MLHVLKYAHELPFSRDDWKNVSWISSVLTAQEASRKMEEKDIEYGWWVKSSMRLYYKKDNK